MKNSTAIWFYLFVVFNCILAETQNKIILVASGAQVNEYQDIPDNNRNNIGVVKGVRDCGGSAKIIEWRYETCTDFDMICHAPTDGVHRTAQVDFVHTTTTERLGLRFIVNSKDGKIAYDIDEGVVSNDLVMKIGQAYTITARGGVTEELKGKEAVFQYILYDANNKNVKVLCAEGDIMYI